MNLCPFGDDLWFLAMAVLNDTKINIIEGNLPMRASFVDFEASSVLWRENAKWRNDWQLQNLLRAYPALGKKILNA